MGLVDGDQRSHVSVPKLNGAVAKCGAGRIVQKVPGFYDPTDPSACPACAQSITVTG
jgi:hypothetical protein